MRAARIDITIRFKGVSELTSFECEDYEVCGPFVEFILDEKAGESVFYPIADIHFIEKTVRCDG